MPGPGKLKGSQFTGPLRTKREGASNIYASGSGRQASITLTAQTAGTSGTYTIADPDALLNDVICVSPLAAGPQANVVSMIAWVSAEGTISVKVTAGAGGALTAGAATLGYFICR